MRLFEPHSSPSRARLSGAYKKDSLLEKATDSTRKVRRRVIREWSLAFILALSAALLIRLLFFEAFRIPSESMEETLTVGDFVLVSKLHYGPRLPITIGLPFTDLYLESVGLPVLRIPGFSEIKRNDVVVFNVPTEPYPIDRKTHYIKRVIGLPGDTLSIVDKVPYAGSDPIDLKAAMKQKWRAWTVSDTEFPLERLQALGVANILQPHRRGDAISFEATAEIANTVREWPEIREVSAIVRSAGLRTRVFPYHRDFGFDNYGPLYIPRKGDVIPLNASNWDCYKDIIVRYEGHSAHKIDENTYEIDGARRDSYEVEQNYYFVMGDNRDSSLDSRAWGFVPEDHVVGKAVLVYFSWDSSKGRARAGRLLKRIE